MCDSIYNIVNIFLDNDDDGDGIPDTEEIVAEVDHAVQSKSPDSDGDGIPDDMDTDDDGDGIPDVDDRISGVDVSPDQIGMMTHFPLVFCQCLVNSFPCPFYSA